MAAWQEAAAPPAREKKAAADRLENARKGWDAAIGLGRRDRADRRDPEEADACPGPAGTREEGPRDPGSRMGRTHRPPRLPSAIFVQPGIDPDRSQSAPLYNLG